MAQQNGRNGNGRIAIPKMNASWVMIWLTFTAMSITTAITAGILFEEVSENKEDAKRDEMRIDDLVNITFGLRQRIARLEAQVDFLRSMPNTGRRPGELQ